MNNIRISKHILKYQNKRKTNYLDKLFSDYIQNLTYYIKLIMDRKILLKTFLSSKELPNDIFSHSAWKQIVYKKASEIVRLYIKLKKNQRYKKYKKIYFYFKSKNRQIKFLNKRFKELNLKEIKGYPEIRNIAIEVNQLCFNIQKGEHFDEFIKLRLPYFQKNKRNAIYINLPIKHHRHSNKFKDWNRKNTIQLIKKDDNYFVNFFYEKEIRERTRGRELGIDIGYNKLLTISDGRIVGQELKDIYNKISRKKQRSRNFKQALLERDNKINEIINKLNLDNVKEIFIETLKNVKYKSKQKRKTYTKFMNKLQRWVYSKVIKKLERVCQEKGIILEKVSPEYTSQTCSECGFIHKDNRKGENFLCVSCGMKIDADINAAINILHRGVYRPSIKKISFVGGGYNGE